MRYRWLLFTICFIAWITNSMAESDVANKQYRIEIIVFSHITQAALKSEQWSYEIAPFYRQLPETQNDPLQLSDELNMTALAEQLNSHPPYHVLIHKAWQASVDDLYRRNDILLTSDDNSIMGTLSLRLQRYFDVSFDLFFDAPSAITHSGYLRLQQTRRMRSDELNYIYHPLYGILMKISRV